MGSKKIKKSESVICGDYPIPWAISAHTYTNEKESTNSIGTRWIDKSSNKEYELEKIEEGQAIWTEIIND